MASFYLTLNWQPSISPRISWEYNCALPVLGHLAKFFVPQLSLRKKSCTPWQVSLCEYTCVFQVNVPSFFSLFSLSHQVMPTCSNNSIIFGCFCSVRFSRCHVFSFLSALLPEWGWYRWEDIFESKCNPVFREQFSEKIIFTLLKRPNW